MIELYTDGACSPNPGLGGWAAIFYKDGVLVDEHYGYVEDTTNNRMEILSVIKGIQAIKNATFDKDITVYSDSQYVVNTMQKNWAKNKNTDLWYELIVLLHDLNVTWVWVKGHDSNINNQRCDRLAVYARVNKVNK